VTDTRARFWVWVTAAAFAALLFWFQYHRWQTFKCHIHDLGLITQTLWNTLHGRAFRTSINPEIGYSSSYLGNHFSPGLAAWLPPFAAWPSPGTLLFLQALALALAAFPLYSLCRDERSPGEACMLVLLYFLQPALWFAGLYDFHHETCCATLGIVVWYCHRRDRPFLLCLVLAFMASLKEHLPLLTAAFGLYLLVFTQRRKLGVVIAVVSVLYFGVVMGVAVPYFNDSPAHSYFERRFPHLGHNVRDALLKCIQHPLEVVGFMLTPRHIYYMVMLLAPWGYLPLLAPSFLLVAFPVLFVNMQSRVEVSYDIGFYHADAVVPWLALAAIHGYARATRLMPRAYRRLGGGLALILVLNGVYWHVMAESAYLPGYRLPLSPRSYALDYEITPHEAMITDIAKAIPPGESLSVQANLACFFTDRATLYPFPHRSPGGDLIPRKPPAPPAEWALVDLTEPYGHRPDYRLFWLEYSLQTKLEIYLQSVQDLLNHPDVELILAADGYLLFHRRKLAQLGGSEPTRTQAMEWFRARSEEWRRFTGRGYGL
jgi:uncharacterized membrane protein